jgi:hypothetical protein
MTILIQHAVAVVQMQHKIFQEPGACSLRAIDMSEADATRTSYHHQEGAGSIHHRHPTLSLIRTHGVNELPTDKQACVTLHHCGMSSPPSGMRTSVLNTSQNLTDHFVTNKRALT